MEITAKGGSFSGEEETFVLVLKDITESVRFENEIQTLNSELRRANEELEAFSYSVSHDLRAPLRSIDGFSQILEEDYSDNVDEEGKRYLKRVRAATQRMALLIDDLLTLSRVNRSEIHRKWVDLSSMAQRIVEELKRQSPDRNVDIQIAPNIRVEGDENLLFQVMENLLSNAWKFSLRKEGPRIVFGQQNGDGQLVQYVRDNGAGFDMKYVGKLFTAFQRLHSDQDFPGTGVGLTTVQRILHRHGGRIWAEGRPGEGAVFYFTVGKNDQGATS